MEDHKKGEHSVTSEKGGDTLKEIQILRLGIFVSAAKTNGNGPSLLFCSDMASFRTQRSKSDENYWHEASFHNQLLNRSVIFF